MSIQKNGRGSRIARGDCHCLLFGQNRAQDICKLFQRSHHYRLLRCPPKRSLGAYLMVYFKDETHSMTISQLAFASRTNDSPRRKRVAIRVKR